MPVADEPGVAGRSVPPAAPPRGRLHRPGLGGLVAGAALIAVLVVICRRVGDPDFYWHLATGNWMLQHLTLPTHDLFTYTVNNRTWADQEWGSELILALVFRAGSFLAVSLVYTAVIWTGMWLIWRRIALERTPSLIAGFSLLVGAAAGVAVWGPRSQMISFTLLAMTLLWIEGYLRDRNRRLFWLPAVMVIWANLHGGFIYALFFVGLAALTESARWAFTAEKIATRRRALGLWAVLGASFLAALVNPHTISVYLIPIHIQLSSAQQSFIAEWKSPSFHSPEEWGLGLMLLLTLCAMALRRQRLWDVLVAVSSTILALIAVRNGAIAVAAVTPVIAWGLAGGWAASLWQARFAAYVDRRRRDLTALATCALALSAVVTGAVVVDTLSGQAASTSANFPEGAADWLLSHPDVGTHMFNAYDWGGYLAYRFSPESNGGVPLTNRRVFIYGEATLMGNQLVQQISDVENAEPDWQQILAEHQIDYVVERPDSALSMALSVDPEWTQVHFPDDGDGAVIFVKR
jgi:hypothetical protein